MIVVAPAQPAVHMDWNKQGRMIWWWLLIMENDKRIKFGTKSFSNTTLNNQPTRHNQLQDIVTKEKHIMVKKNEAELSPTQRKELLKILKTRFEKNMNRHKGI